MVDGVHVGVTDATVMHEQRKRAQSGLRGSSESLGPVCWMMWHEAHQVRNLKKIKNKEKTPKLL